MKKGIKIENLCLSYGKNQVLTGLNETIPAHKVSVVYGPSGSGKSTFLDIILGLNSYESGRVFIDNIELKKIDINAWRKIIGYVPQENFLFNDTIAQNVSLGDESISEAAIIKALKQADVWEFICTLGDGLNHVVGEKGGKLSGGQRQRIALARALVRQPEILILDEATSNLDEDSERKILGVLLSMRPDLTIIIVSHNPTILDIADHVIYFGDKEQ